MAEIGYFAWAMCRTPACLLLCLVLGLLSPLARAGEMAAALRARHWAAAAAMVATAADPVARKLVVYQRLLTPGGGTATEIAQFIAANPSWPNGALLGRRFAEALAAEPDPAVAYQLCQRALPQEAAALLRCASAADELADLPAAAAAAEQAWVVGIIDPAQEQAFLIQWGACLTPADQWRRFDRLAWADTAAPGGPAARQLARLAPEQRAGAIARLALRRDEPAGRTLALAVPDGLASDPGLLLELARFLRRAGQDAEAQALWFASGVAAEQAAPASRRPAFWAERDLLAHHRLREADPAGAYALVDGAAGLAPEQATEAEFVAGFIALRWRNDPATAARHFVALAALGHAALTQARAAYWTGRADAAAGDAAGSYAAYAAAAAWPTTFYGQLAARALGEDDAALAARIRSLQDPRWTPPEALAFLGGENARAAALLTAWDEPRQARAFLGRLEDLAATPAEHALAARLAADLGMVDVAVGDARRAGRDGVILPQAGWPLAVTPPIGLVEPALTLGLIRQESNFNTEAVSPTGARGLMQLMPATAQFVAQTLGQGALNQTALTTDPAYNMRLGTAYLAGLLDQFGGAMPLAVAAYNAGPNRVAEWLVTNQDPRQGSVAMLDWIELIPFAETRNYVQRVIENVVVYRARTGQVLPHPLARWLG